MDERTPFSSIAGKPVVLSADPDSDDIQIKCAETGALLACLDRNDLFDHVGNFFWFD